MNVNHNLLLRGNILFGCFFWLLLVMFILFSGNQVKALEEESDLDRAQVLDELGLFKGTESGYDLDEFADRNQSAVMLVRLLGLEESVVEEYNNGNLNHPFIDVPSWASPHVAYLYEEGLTNGVSDMEYGGSSLLTANQYSTMLLRLLGFDDSIDEFHWSRALKFFVETYAINNESISVLLDNGNDGLKRGKMVSLSYKLLYLNYKNMDYEVIDSLYFNEVFTKDLYNKYQEQEQYAYDGKDEVRSVWLSFLDLKSMIANKSLYGFRKEIEQVMINISDTGFNNIYVQVRPFSDALYDSEVYDWSYIMTGTDGQGLGYDPFEIVIEEAKKNNITVEAWINPYRIRNDVAKNPLDPNGKVSQLMTSRDDVTIRIGNRLIFNPGDDDVKDLIVSGVAEIVNKYDVDGIHFDDYFYPSQDMSIDQVYYEEYIDNGGSLTRADYRRERINILVKEVYTTIKSIDNQVAFGISPQGSSENNYNHSYIDVEEWITEGYIDYICPQIYYGFNNETSPFYEVLNEWNEMVDNSNADLYIGLAAYKIGQYDSWAGSGSDEWIEKSSRLKMMVELSRTKSNYNGVSIFRYNSLFKPINTVKAKVSKEVEELKMLFIK